MTVQELAELVRQSETVVTRDPGLDGTAVDFRPPVAAIDLSGLNRIVSIEAEDQVVVVEAGCRIQDLQEALAPHGLCLPVPTPGCLGSTPAHTVGGALDLGFPHLFEAQCGTWRDWLLGATFVMASGELVKSGSKAVKSVAGYDVHRLMVGARGTLAIFATVNLRVYPLRALPIEPELPPFGPEPVWIQRTLASDFAEASRNAIIADPLTSTVWAHGGPFERFAHDWVVAPRPWNSHEKRLKDLFDPQNRLNPGALGEHNG